MIPTVALAASKFGCSKIIAHTTAIIFNVLCQGSSRRHSVFWTKNKVVCQHFHLVSVGGRTLSVVHMRLYRGYNAVSSLVEPAVVGNGAILGSSAVGSILPYSIGLASLLVLFKVRRLAAR